MNFFLAALLSIVLFAISFIMLVILVRDKHNKKAREHFNIEIDRPKWKKFIRNSVIAISLGIFLSIAIYLQIDRHFRYPEFFLVATNVFLFLLVARNLAKTLRKITKVKRWDCIILDLGKYPSSDVNDRLFSTCIFALLSVVSLLSSLSTIKRTGSIDSAIFTLSLFPSQAVIAIYYLLLYLFFHLQFTEKGIVKECDLIFWKDIQAYKWDTDSDTYDFDREIWTSTESKVKLYLLTRSKSRFFPLFPCVIELLIPQQKKQEVDNILQQYIN